MKVQWQSRRFYPDLYGGSEVIGYEVVKEWRKIGVAVSVATENYQKSELLYDEPIEGVCCSRIPTGGLGIFWRVGAFARVCRWAWHQKDIADEADVVFASNPECVVASKTVNRSRPVIYRCEGITPYFLPVLNRRISKQFMFVEKRAMRLADAIVVASRIVKEQLVNYVDVDENKVFVVPYGVDFSRFSEAEIADELKEFRRKGEFVIACIGRLTREKGIDYLIEAFSRLKRKEEARLVIIGDGMLRDELKRYANDRGLNGRVVFAGKVSNPERYLAGADVHALMSRYETFGLAHIEAMSAGVPTISWRSRFDDSLVAASEIIIEGKTGFCIEPRDVSSLSKLLDELIGNRKIVFELGRNAQEYVKRTYSWKKTAEEYLRVIENVVR